MKEFFEFIEELESMILHFRDALTLVPWSKTPLLLRGWLGVCSQLTGMTNQLHQTSCLMQNRKEQKIQWNSY